MFDLFHTILQNTDVKCEQNHLLPETPFFRCCAHHSPNPRSPRLTQTQMQTLSVNKALGSVHTM